MSFTLRFTEEAADNLKRLYAFAAGNDPVAAEKALETIAKAWELLVEFPFSCRRAEGADAFLRELVISFGDTGYVALFEIENNETVTGLAVRPQREDDYH
ncbi:MAG: type II toxin-antitoxin system RelE/ParE family toxin [Mariprofundaceae bacterium]|nr:type II toxin-antitoxin system RelE/ParE family toxin [Mariprofundaceae bacterium]